MSLTQLTDLQPTNIKVTGIATFDQTVGIAGTLTYQDVTNIDSVGLITARSGIHVSGGNVKIGTTTEGYSSADDLTISTSGTTGITIRSGTSNTGTLAFSDGTSGADEYRGYIQYEHQNDALAFGSNGTEKFRISSTGNVSIGNNATPDTLLHLQGDTPKLRIESTNTLEASAGTEEIARIEFEATKSSNRNVAASMRVRQDGTWSTVDDWFSPTAIEFYTQDQSGTEITTPRLTINRDGEVGITDTIFHIGDTDTKIRFPVANQISFETQGSEAVRIDESGKVGIGHVNPSQLLTVRGNAPIIRIEENQSGASKRLDLGVTNSGAIGFIGANQSASSLAFQTVNNERMRITSTGLVGIGTDNPNRELTVYGADPIISIQEASVSSQVDLGTGTSTGFINIQKADGTRTIQLNGSGESYFNSGSSVRIGHTSYAASSHSDDLIVGAQNSGHNRGITILNHSNQDGRIGFAEASGTNSGMIKYSHGSNVMQFYVEAEEMVRLNNTSVQGNSALELRKPNAASNVQSHMIHFLVSGHQRGAVIAASAYGGSAIVGAISDYRVKTNIRDYTGGWDNIKALPVKIFDISKEGEEATDIKGWIAHEVQSVIPEAVIGTKDAKNEDGSDQYQSLGYNVFMPDVVGALQTAMAKIETLEAKVAALEGS